MPVVVLTGTEDMWMCCTFIPDTVPGSMSYFFQPSSNSVVYLIHVEFRGVELLCFLTHFSYFSCLSEPIFLNMLFLDCGRPLYHTYKSKAVRVPSIRHVPAHGMVRGGG